MSESVLASQAQIAHPLDEFYARARQPLPPLQTIDAEEIPAPYKQLLVHENDMTSTLEHFHEGRIHLRVLSQELDSGNCRREVGRGVPAEPSNAQKRLGGDASPYLTPAATYSREVVLELDGANTPVEFGAIKIYLTPFPANARERILEAHWPLGRILKEFKLAYLSRPKTFLRIASDRLISSALQLTGTHRLYGRCNRLSDPQGNVLAEIVEILPPINDE